MKSPFPKIVGRHLLPALSLVLCIATVIPWICTEEDDAQCSFYFRGTRYTIHSYEGRLTLSGPLLPFTPHISRWTDSISDYTAPTTSQGLSEAFQRASEIRGIDIWRFRDPPPATKPALSGIAALFGDHSTEPEYASPTIDAFYPLRYDPSDIRIRANLIALLLALEDPHRCVAANSVLRNYARMDLLPNPRIDSYGDLVHRWHDRIDQRVFSAWYGSLCFVTSILPLLHLTRPSPSRRYIRRWIFNAASLLSAACATAVVFAALTDGDRGFSVFQVFYNPKASRPTEIRLLFDWHHGTVSFGAQQGREAIGEWAETHDIKCRSSSLLEAPRTAWIERWNVDDWETIGRIIRLPWPLVAAVLTLLPVARVVQFLRSAKPIPGHCPHCNYDLRATPTRCPECGCDVLHLAASSKVNRSAHFIVSRQ